MKWMPNGSDFALSDKHVAAFMRMGVQAIQWPCNLVKTIAQVWKLEQILRLHEQHSSYHPDG